MNCMYCGFAAGHERICPSCGADLSAQIKAARISNAYYNRGLDKAAIRDLSGAVDDLERSLKFNKRNITARNLLGLIYFETGEVVSALSQWIISKNLSPRDNIASEYIAKLQENPERLDAINQSARRYNRALEACRDGNEDIAQILLKKVLAGNSHLIKAYHLLALIHIKNGEWDEAKEVLQKAVPIDRTNATTLRFMKEIHEHTGRERAGADEKHSIMHSKKKNAFVEAVGRIKDRAAGGSEERLLIDDEMVDDVEARINQAETVQPVAFRDTSAFSGLLYIVLGIVMGALVIWFLVVPSVRQDASRTANEQMAELNTVIARQAASIDEKDAELAGYGVSVTTATEQLSQASTQFNAMEKLVEAYNAFRSGNYDMAETTLQSLDPDALSVGARTMRLNLLSDAGNQLYAQYLQQGVAAYDAGNYGTAIEQLLKAHEIKTDEYDALSYLAASYRHTNQADAAVRIYMEIIAQFPGTQRSESAEYYMDRVQKGILEDSVVSTAAEEKAMLEAQARAEAEAAARAAAEAQAQAEAEAAARAAQEAQNAQNPEGQPAEGQPQEGQPAEGQPQEGQPAEGQPAEGMGE